MNHNKKRNTAFLYEVLLREGTKAALEKNITRAKEIKSIIVEYFSQKTELYKELELYSSLKDNTVEEELAESFLKEVENRYFRLNPTKIFNEQSRLINKINKSLGQNVFNNFVPNYKDLATISLVFNPKTKVKDKILLEKVILEKIKIVNDKKEQKNLQPVDNFLLKTFTKKFNEKYSGLLSEQKELLTNYINSFSNNMIEFKVYLNEELDRLKKAVSESMDSEDIKKDPSMKEKTLKTLNFLNNFKDVKDISQDMLEKILKIQQFVKEVAN